MGRVRLRRVCAQCRLKHRKCDNEPTCQMCLLHQSPELCVRSRGTSLSRSYGKTKTRIRPRLKRRHLSMASTIVNEEEARIFHHWCVETVCYFDLFDEDRQFAKIVSVMARKSRLLMSAILSFTAKEVYRGVPDKCEIVVNKYYNESISLLIADLEKTLEDHYTVATVVVLCAHEVRDASWENWRKHLYGMSSMLRSGGETRCMGLWKAAFWIFARIDTQLSIGRSTLTSMDPQAWPIGDDTDGGDIDRDDFQANQVLRILAMVSNYLAAKADSTVKEQLLDDLDNFKNSLPQKFNPIAILPGAIPSVLYMSSAQGSMFQMYHLAHILLLGTQDSRSKSHAMEIIGISEAGLEPKARVHAIQPLFYAGKVLKGINQRQFVISCLAEIDSQLGWATEKLISLLQRDWEDSSAYELQPQILM